VSIENLLALFGIAAEAAFLAMLIWRRAYRTLPVFFSYIAWGFAGDSAVLLLRALAPGRNIDVWVVETYIDSLFQYAVLIELAWSTLRPVRGSLPKGFLTGVSLVIAVAAAAAWPLCTMKDAAGHSSAWMLALHAQRSFAVMRIVFFLVISCCSQFLRIGWHDRELQVATGLGFYSLVSLGATMIHVHQAFGLHYFYVDVAVAASYLLSLFYWIFSFAQQDAPRRAMTPEMESLLLRLAATMRRQREALTDPDITR
jgi:hypothetical protein